MTQIRYNLDYPFAWPINVLGCIVPSSLDDFLGGLVQD